MPTRVHMTSPPKESFVSRFNNANFAIFSTITLSVAIVAACVMGSLYIVYGH